MAAVVLTLLAVVVLVLATVLLAVLGLIGLLVAAVRRRRGLERIRALRSAIVVAFVLSGVAALLTAGVVALDVALRSSMA